MISIIIAALIVLITLGYVFVAAANPDEQLPKIGPFLGGLVLAGLVVFASCWTQVPTRNVGVPTNFGKTTGETLNPGLHFVPPWTKVTDIDATVQTEEYRGDECIYVRIADGTSACISMTYRWRIKPEAADIVYSDYRNSDTDINDAVRKALVSTNVKASINEALADYNPLTFANEIDSDSTPEELAKVDVQVAPDYVALNEEIGSLLNEKIEAVGDLIEVQQITVSYINLSQTTEDKINAFVGAVQETRIALQNQATKAAEAEGNRLLSDSISRDPNVLVSKCLDLLESGIAVPAGFQCWPGTGGSVVLPAVN